MNESEPIAPFPGKDDINLDGGSDLINQISRLSDANRRLRRKIFDHYTVFEISRHLSSMLDTESLIDAILLTCLGQMGAESAAIFLADSGLQFLTNPHSKGVDLKGLTEYQD